MAPFEYHPAMKSNGLISVFAMALTTLFYFPNSGMAQPLADSIGTARLPGSTLALNTDASGAIIPSLDFGLTAAATGIPQVMLMSGQMMPATRATAGFAPAYHADLMDSRHNSSFDADSVDGLYWDAAGTDVTGTACSTPESNLTGSNSTISDNANDSGQVLAQAGESLNIKSYDSPGDSGSKTKGLRFDDLANMSHASIAVTILFFAILCALAFVLWRRLLLLG